MTVDPWLVRAKPPGEERPVGQRTALYAAQLAAGAKMIDFVGWDMPVLFAGPQGGILAEHRAVRTAAGVFDLGHMGRVGFDGPGAVGFLERCCTRKLSNLALGQVRYALVLAEDGTVEDDILVSRESESRSHVVVNGVNRAKLLAIWSAMKPAELTIRDLTAEQAMFAVQGPEALDLLAGLGLDGRTLRSYRMVDATWNGVPVRISRTGYTGEDGAELFLPAGSVEALWQAVVAAGGVPCGLGARDTLRLEAAMPLYGHELDRTVTPIEAGLAFAVRAEGGFIGAGPVLDQLEHGASRKLVGLVVPERRVPRQGYPVLAGDRQVGVITSGTLSPTLNAAIAMALVERAAIDAGTALTVDVRGTRCAATLTPLPFYRRPR